MTKNAFSVLAALLLFAFAGTAHAAKRVALVIGNSAYQNATPLKNPLNDATDIAKRLRGLDFDVVEGIDLDMDGMRQTVRRFIRKTEGADVALFFYAGHGLQVSGTNYLAPVDANLESAVDLQFETLPVEFVLAPMETNAKTSIVFLDACRNNPLARNLARSMGTRSASVGRGLAAIGSGVGTLISYATQPGNVALDGEGRNSPFTTALLAHIGKPGIGINATMAAVRRDVLDATNGNQVPWEHSSLTGAVVLKAKAGPEETPVAAPEPPKADPGKAPGNPETSQQVELALWEAIEGSADPLLFQDYLGRYPDGVFSTVARKRIAALIKPPATPANDGSNSVSDSGHCRPSKLIFNATVEGSSKVVSLCGAPQWLQYHFGPVDRSELVVPASKGGSNNAFTFSQKTAQGATRLKLEFANGDYRYAILENFEDQSARKSSTSLRVTRISTGEAVANHNLVMSTEPLALVQIQNQVRTAPYDEPSGADGGSAIMVGLEPESHCNGAKVWFSAEVRNTGKFVSVCGSDSPDGRDAWLTYHYGLMGSQELIFPTSRKGSTSAFTYRRQVNGQATYLKFEFTNGGYRYIIREGNVSKKSVAELRVDRVSDGANVASFDLDLKTGPLSLMQLEDKVPTRPYK